MQRSSDGLEELLATPAISSTASTGVYNSRVARLLPSGVPVRNKFSAFDVLSGWIFLEEVGGGVNLAAIRTGTVLTTMVIFTLG